MNDDNNDLFSGLLGMAALAGAAYLGYRHLRGQSSHFYGETVCPLCGGARQIVGFVCTSCGGTGVHRRIKLKHVTDPSQLPPGTTIETDSPHVKIIV